MQPAGGIHDGVAPLSRRGWAQDEADMMIEIEKRDATQLPAARQPGSGGLFENKVVLLGVIVIAQLLTAVAITRLFIEPRFAPRPAAEAGAGRVSVPSGRTGELVGLGEMIVTLRDDSVAPHYLRTNVSLEVAGARTVALVGERRPQLRDIVIMSLSQRTAAHLLTPDGKEDARREIAARIGEKLPLNALINVYFSDLMIQ